VRLLRRIQPLPSAGQPKRGWENPRLKGIPKPITNAQITIVENADVTFRKQAKPRDRTKITSHKHRLVHASCPRHNFLLFREHQEGLYLDSPMALDVSKLHRAEGKSAGTILTFFRFFLEAPLFLLPSSEVYPSASRLAPSSSTKPSP
jgi:hypothetical protein